MSRDQHIGLLDLNDDLLLRIGSLSAAEDVLTLERVCGRLQQLVSQPNRILWLAHLNELDDFHAPDLLPHLFVDSLSSTQLKTLVSRALQGERNWSSKTRPRIVRRITLNLRNTGLLGDLKTSRARCNENVKLVPGGGLVNILWSEGYIQCWDLSKKNCIWTYPMLGDFNDFAVVAYDAYHDFANDILTFVLVEKVVGVGNGIYDRQINWVELNLKSKKARLKSSFSINLLSDDILVRISKDGAILELDVGILLFDGRGNRLQILDLHGIDFGLATNTFQFVEDKLIFVANDRRDSFWKLFVLNIRGILTSNRFFPKTNSNTKRSLPLSDLTAFYTSVQIPLSENEKASSVNLVSCKPTWCKNNRTTLYVVTKLDSLGHSDWSTSHSYFRVFSFLLTSSFVSLRSSEDDDVGTSVSLNLPPRLLFLHAGPRKALPLAHSYCVDDVHFISHGLRAILTSRNTLHSAVRCFALPIARLLDADNGDDRPLQPLIFGKELVAPGQVYMEKYSGAVSFASKDEKTLVIQYYD